MSRLAGRAIWLGLAVPMLAGCGSAVGPQEPPDPGHPLEVAATLPTDGQVGVAADAPIEIRFADPVADPSTGRWFVLPDPGEATERWSADRTELFLDHAALAADTIYTVILRNYAAAGHGAMAELRFSFSTQAAQEDPVLTVVSTLPADRAVDVSLTAAIEIAFSHPVIDKAAGKVIFVPGVSGQERRWEEGGRRLIIEHPPLAAGQAYSVTVEGYRAAPDKPMAPFAFGFTT